MSSSSSSRLAGTSGGPHGNRVGDILTDGRGEAVDPQHVDIVTLLMRVPVV
jgi:hypothetical protein